MGYKHTDNDWLDLDLNYVNTSVKQLSVMHNI